MKYSHPIIDQLMQSLESQIKLQNKRLRRGRIFLGIVLFPFIFAVFMALIYLVSLAAVSLTVWIM